MANFKPKYSSECISVERMHQVCNNLHIVLLEVLGNATCKAMYGWSCDLHIELLWKPMQVPQSMMESFIRDSISQRIFLPGKSDLIIESPDEKLTLNLNHESDIHVDGSDDELIKKFVTYDSFNDIKFYSRKELREKYPDRFGDSVD